MHGSVKNLQKLFSEMDCDKCVQLNERIQKMLTVNKYKNVLNKTKQHKRKSDILKFYFGNGTDQSKRTIHDIWNFSNNQLEKVHNYIQWIFPTSKKSDYNTHAPVLTKKDMQQFSEGSNSVIYKKNMRHSLDLMLHFYGLKRIKNKISIDPSCFKSRSKQWLLPDNHNLYRLTRIIQSLTECGLEREAKALYQCLLNDIYPMFPYETSTALNFWKQSLTPREKFF